jgi:hypothetical protein
MNVFLSSVNSSYSVLLLEHLVAEGHKNGDDEDTEANSDNHQLIDNKSGVFQSENKNK